MKAFVGLYGRQTSCDCRPKLNAIISRKIPQIESFVGNLRFSYIYFEKCPREKQLDKGHCVPCANCNFHLASSINALASLASSCLKLR